jgi:hypothetical protein
MSLLPGNPAAPGHLLTFVFDLCAGHGRRVDNSAPVRRMTGLRRASRSPLCFDSTMNRHSNDEVGAERICSHQPNTDRAVDLHLVSNGLTGHRGRPRLRSDVQADAAADELVAHLITPRPFILRWIGIRDTQHGSDTSLDAAHCDSMRFDLTPESTGNKMNRPSAIRTAVALLCSALASAHAATYYVNSSSGNDTNSGTTTSLTWKTLLSGGAIWQETLNVKAGVTYSTYGSTSRAIISGSRPITSRTWTRAATGSNIWYITTTPQIESGSVSQVLVNGLQQTRARTPNIGKGDWAVTSSRYAKVAKDGNDTTLNLDAPISMAQRFSRATIRPTYPNTP